MAVDYNLVPIRYRADCFAVHRCSQEVLETAFQLFGSAAKSQILAGTVRRDTATDA